MKTLATMVLAATLLACPAFAQDKKGYDMGACSTDSYLAAHMSVVGKDLEMDTVSRGPNKIEPMEKKLLYKFQSSDKEGNHYLAVVGDEKLTIVVDFDKSVGYFSVDGKLSAVLMFVEDADGSKLADKAILMFKVCQELVNDTPEEMPNVSKS